MAIIIGGVITFWALLGPCFHAGKGSYKTGGMAYMLCCLFMGLSLLLLNSNACHDNNLMTTVVDQTPNVNLSFSSSCSMGPGAKCTIAATVSRIMLFLSWFFFFVNNDLNIWHSCFPYLGSLVCCRSCSFEGKSSSSSTNYYWNAWRNIYKTNRRRWYGSGNRDSCEGGTSTRWRSCLEQCRNIKKIMVMFDVTCICMCIYVEWEKLVVEKELFTVMMVIIYPSKH